MARSVNGVRGGGRCSACWLGVSVEKVDGDATRAPPPPLPSPLDFVALCLARMCAKAPPAKLNPFEAVAAGTEGLSPGHVEVEGWVGVGVE